MRAESPTLDVRVAAASALQQKVDETVQPLVSPLEQLLPDVTVHTGRARPVEPTSLSTRVAETVVALDAVGRLMVTSGG